MECSRFILELAQTALEESERCRGLCGALKKLTSEVVANDQEIKNSRKWESNEPLKHLKEIQRSSKFKELQKSKTSTINRPKSGWKQHWMHQSDRSRFPGKIRFKRLLKKPANTVHNFKTEARQSSVGIQKKLRGKIASAAEMKFKLGREQKNGVLYFLSDFLKLQDVKDQGINKDNVESYLSFCGLLMVLNLASTSSPLRVVANPAQRTKTGYMANHNISAGEAYIEHVKSMFLRLRLNPICALGDIQDFYLNVRLDAIGALSGAVFLQRDKDGSAVLDPNLDAPLEVAVFVASRFGQVDAGTLAALARNHACDAYLKNYPDNEDKLSIQMVEKVRKIIEKAYVDDVLLTHSAKSMEENKEPLSKTGYVGQHGSDAFEEKAMAISRILEFSGFTLKRYVMPPDRQLQAEMNRNPLLACNKPEITSKDRPSATEVHQEGMKKELQKKKKLDQASSIKYQVSNTKTSINSKAKDHLLGIAWHENDQLGLRQKLLNVGKARGGVRPKETEIDSAEGFERFVKEKGSLTRRQHLSLISQAYNPLGDIAGIYHLVSRIITRQIMLSSSSVLKWEEKIDPKWNKQTKQLIRLFYLLQAFRIKRYAVSGAYPRDLKISIWIFCDGSEQAAASLTYIRTTDKNGHHEVNLLQCQISTSTLGGRTAAANECRGGEMGAASGVEVCNHFQEEGFEIEEVGIIFDANYVLSLSRNYAGRLKPPFNGSIGRLQLSVASLANLEGIKKKPSLFGSLYYIDQQAKIKSGNSNIPTTNFADLVSKVHLETDTADVWMERWEQIHRAEWLRLDQAKWVSAISNMPKDLIRKKTLPGNHLATLPQFNHPEINVNKIETFMAKDSTEPEVSSTSPLIAIPNDLDDGNNQIEHSQPLYNPYDFSPFIKKCDCKQTCGCEHQMSTRFSKIFSYRHNPLDCAMRTAGAVLWAKKKFISLTKKRLIGNYDTNRSQMADAGLWLLTAESAERTGPHLKRLRSIIKDMQVIGVHTKGLIAPIALGRQMRKNLGPTTKKKHPHFILRLLRKKSPLVEIIVQQFHRGSHNVSPETLMKRSIREGFLWSGCEDTFQTFRQACMQCKIKQATFRDLVREQAMFGPDSTLEHLTSRNILDIVIIDQTGPYKILEGDGSFHLLMVVELTTRRCHLLPIESMSSSAILAGLRTLSSRRGAWRVIVADQATTHSSLGSYSTMEKVDRDDIGDSIIPDADKAASRDLQGFLSNPTVQAAALKLNMTFKVSSAESHHSVGLSEDISRRIKIWAYDLFRGAAVETTFEAFSRAAVMEEVINSRIIAIEPDGSVISPNSFLHAAGLHSNRPTGDLTLMSGSKSRPIIESLNEMRETTKSILDSFANHYASHLLVWTHRKYGVKDINVGDVVLLLDRLHRKFYDPSYSALGRVHKVSYGQRQFQIQMTWPTSPGIPRPKRNPIHEFLNRPRKSLVLLLRADENLNRPTWVDPWMGLTNQAIVKMHYNPLKINFFNDLDKIPPVMSNDEINQQPSEPTSVTVVVAEPEAIIEDLIIKKTRRSDYPEDKKKILQVSTNDNDNKPTPINVVAAEPEAMIKDLNIEPRKPKPKPKTPRKPRDPRPSREPRDPRPSRESRQPARLNDESH